jgi:cation transport regulator
MRYETRKDLPATITDVLPQDAQEIYLEAYRAMWDEYDEESTGHLSSHEVAHRQGWMAIERAFVQDPKTGTWHRKGEQKAEEDKGLLDKVKDVIEDIVS